MLLLATSAVLVLGVFKTFPMLRVERILSLVRRSTVDALERVEATLVGMPLAFGGGLALPPNAAPVRAGGCGYIVEVDVRTLVSRARRARLRVRICRAVGEYVDRDEIVGWAVREGGGTSADLQSVRSLARAVTIAPNRELDHDPIYGVRILSDVAARALSSSSNDPYTARQALQQLRSVLRHLMLHRLGDRNVTDADGAIRVSINCADLREFISVGVEAPLRLGAGEPEVLDAVLEIALEIGLLARDAASRDLAHALVSRVLEDAAVYGRLDRSRKARLLVQADLVHQTLVRDGPRADRHARSVWALMREEDVGRVSERMEHARA
jgi:uncharacterized membrane protein